MRIPLVVYLALSSSLTHATLAPIFEQMRMSIWQLFSSVSHTQFPFTFIVILGVVSLWRGAWGLMDLHLFPKNSSLSYIVSLVIGVIILLSTYDLAKQFL
jgi:uncharacterized membrane protein YeaQ/YmgE (transglycosylase-associated protein family)